MSVQLMVLLFTDIVGSLDLKKRLGDVKYQDLAARHDQLFSETVDSLSGAKIIKDTGDGFLARFARASDAVNAALRFQQLLHAEPWDPEPIHVRVGIHIGEVAERGTDATGRPKLVGLAADIAGRVMGMGLAGQTLMTRTTFDDARQYLSVHPTSGDLPTPKLEWRAHGRYLFQGSDESLAVFEVGGKGIAPLVPPPDSEKTHRVLDADEESTLGWRPAIGIEVVGRKGWVLNSKLGEGGFGEVWLAKHDKTGDDRVFKFCFDVDRLQSFKRELTLFRLIRQALGDRKDIAKLHEIRFEQPPYFLESEFSEFGDVGDWAAREGGIDQVPAATRLDMMIRTAEAVAAAHSIGILHKDIKPSNILVYKGESGEPLPRLADFGIGVLTDRAQLEARNITEAGFTEAVMGNESSRTGTRIYAPPESLIGQPFSIQGDIYALGVLLYQMTVGELQRPLGAGWERDVDDPVLREDIARCVDHDPSRRLSSAAELAQRLRSLDERRTARTRVARRRRFTRVGAALAAVAVVAAVALGIHTGQVTRERDRANQEAEAAKQISEFLQGLFEVSDPDETRGASITAREILDRGAEKIRDEMADQPIVQARLMNTMGLVFKKLGLYEDSRPLLEQALEIRRVQLGERHLDSVWTMQYLADLIREMGDYPEAQQLYEQTIAIREAELGSDHPDLLESLNNFGLLLWYKKDRDAARKIWERVLATRERDLDRDDPLIAQSLNNLALVLWQDGDLDRAQKLFERALKIREKEHGDDHPRVAVVLNNLGNLHIDAEDLEGARPLYERAIGIYEVALGPDHPKLARTVNNYAYLLSELGDAEGARRNYARSLAIREKAFGPEHPAVAVPLNGLAGLLKAGGDYDGARPLFARALKILETSLGTDHPGLEETLTEFADLLRKAHDAAGAERLENRARALTESGRKHLQ